MGAYRAGSALAACTVQACKPLGDQEAAFLASYAREGNASIKPWADARCMKQVENKLGLDNHSRTAPRRRNREQLPVQLCLLRMMGEASVEGRAVQCARAAGAGAVGAGGTFECTVCRCITTKQLKNV